MLFRPRLTTWTRFSETKRVKVGSCLSYPVPFACTALLRQICRFLATRFSWPHPLRPDILRGLQTPVASKSSRNARRRFRGAAQVRWHHEEHNAQEILDLQCLSQTTEPSLKDSDMQKCACCLNVGDGLNRSFLKEPFWTVLFLLGHAFFATAVSLQHLPQVLALSLVMTAEQQLQHGQKRLKEVQHALVDEGVLIATCCSTWTYICFNNESSPPSPQPQR